MLGSSSEPPVYQKFMLAKLQSAVARMALNVYKDLCPSSQLDALLASEKCDASAMQEKIAKCQVVTHKTKEGGKEIKDQVPTGPPSLSTTSSVDEVAVEGTTGGKEIKDQVTTSPPSLSTSSRAGEVAVVETTGDKEIKDQVTTGPPGMSTTSSADEVAVVGTTGDYPESITDMDLDILIYDGTFVCIQRVKQPTLFGVLVRDVTKDEPCGPCLMMDLTYEMINYDTFSLRTLEMGVEEMNRQPYPKQALVIKHLKKFLRIEREDEQAMELSVAASVRLYEKKASKFVGTSSRKSSATDANVTSLHQIPLMNVTGVVSINAPAAAGLENTKHDEQHTDDDVECQGVDTVSTDNCTHYRSRF
jgi:hypothetical protein